MLNKRPLERVTFVHHGKVVTCVVVDRPLVAASPEVPARPSNGVWSVTMAGVRRNAFERDVKGDTQENVVSRVIAWYEREVVPAAEPRPGTDAIR